MIVKNARLESGAAQDDKSTTETVTPDTTATEIAPPRLK
jgi:hypothetical protein